MSTNLTLLDRALILAQHELEAMRSGDVENAESHFHERIELMKKARNSWIKSAVSLLRPKVPYAG